MHLTITQERIDPNITVVRLEGRLTMGPDSDEFESQISELIRLNQQRIVLDLTQLNYMDSTGLGTVASCSGKLRQAGGELCLAGLKGSVQKLFKVTGVERIFPIHATAAQGIEYFGGRATGA
jgi:anti-sigma B factor antagonist